MKDLLERIKEKGDSEFEAWEIQATNRDLIKLMKLGIVKITLKTNRSTLWKVCDLDKLNRLLELRKTKIKLPKDEPLFSSIIGHEKHKELILRALESKEPIHLLLLGHPSTAKTLFLLELTKLEGSEYITPYITYSGLYDLLITKPKLLLIDQIDNVKENGVYKLLIDLMEYGIITKLTHGIKERSKYNTKVIATANSIKRIPRALLSRFLIVRFRLYSEKEYRQIVENLLKDVNKELRDYIIQKTIERRDVRNALKLAKICKTKEDVDKYMEIIRLS